MSQRNCYCIAYQCILELKPDADACYHNVAIPNEQVLPRLWPQSFRGCPQPHQNDALLAAALQHFARRCAWDVAADFFASIVKSYAPAVVQLAYALCQLAKPSDALHVRLHSVGRDR